MPGHFIVPVSLNDSLIPKRRVAMGARKKRMPYAELSYSVLRDEMSRRAAGEGQNAQSTANLHSALRGFQSQFGLSDDSVVATTLRISYYKYLAVHVSKLKSEGRAESYIANRKTALKRWRNLVSELDRIHAIDANEPSPFQKALSTLVSNAHSQAAVARQAGVPLSSLKRWLRGSRPNERAIPSLRRLERFFGQPVGALLELLQGLPGTQVQTTVGEPPQIAYRARLRKASRESYRLNGVNDGLRQQWLDFVRYKTSPTNRLIPRHRNSRWSIATESAVAPSPARWYAFLNGMYVPTANIAWSHISQFLGWFALDSADGGGGYEPEQAQTLAWLADIDTVERYIPWRIARGGGHIHRGITQLLLLLSMLLHPRTGYLTNQPHFLETLPESLRTRDWNEMCATTYRYARESLVAYQDDGTSMSRNPFEPLAAVLTLKNPLEAVADMVCRMKADRPMTAGRNEAIWGRDIVLIKLLASNPLRAKNMKLIRYRPDNTGNLYQKPDGSWHLRIAARAFKNFRGAAKRREYDMPVDRNAWPDIETYIKIYRPMLADSASPYFFVASKRGASNGVWSSLGRHVESLTRRYLWQCPGTGPHGFRHIVATSILKQSPNDWNTAAMVLHDLPATVEAYYAHLRSSDGANRMYEMMSGTFSRM